MCPSCKELHVEFVIKGPGELAKAIRIAQANVADGTLETIEPPNASVLGSSASIDRIKSDGPWNDVVFYLFRCVKYGARFKLSAETYHGSGGSWSPEDDGGAA